MGRFGENKYKKHSWWLFFHIRRDRLLEREDKRGFLFFILFFWLLLYFFLNGRNNIMTVCSWKWEIARRKVDDAKEKWEWKSWLKKKIKEEGGSGLREEKVNPS